MITPETFDQETYKRTGWKAGLVRLESDLGKPRLIVRVATGRKYWPIISTVINQELGKSDPSIELIERQIHGFTHPMIERFVSELETMISDIYRTEIKLKRPR